LQFLVDVPAAVGASMITREAAIRLSVERADRAENPPRPISGVAQRWTQIACRERSSNEFRLRVNPRIGIGWVLNATSAKRSPVRRAANCASNRRANRCLRLAARKARDALRPESNM